MGYSSQDDLITRFGEKELIQLTDRTGSKALDPDVVARALADADALIDGYLASKYLLPLDNVPTVISRLAGDIARYYLYEDRVTDAVKQRFIDAIQYLKDVANGVQALSPSDAGEQPAEPAGIAVKAATRVFSQDTLKDY